jgi:hypothetical protein
MTTDNSYSHLNEQAKALINESDEARIAFIRGGTWLNYPRAKEALAKLEDLLAYPKITRMPNLLLVAPSFNGKTSILERFVAQHPAVVDPDGEKSICEVVMIEAPSTPDVSAFYSRILDALMAIYKPTASAQAKNSQIKILFEQLGVKMLIIDEIHHLIAGSLNRQKDFRNALKSLGNETKIVIVASGIEDAFTAFNTDPQMSSRFTPFELPLWKANNQFGALLATLELKTPLKKPSNLKSPEKMQQIFYRTEGTLGDMHDFFKELAVNAIRTGAEEITFETINSLDWVPPSKRKQYRRF